MLVREMKDSGVEWIGKIPSDWVLYKIKNLGRYINGFPFKPEDWGTKGKPIIRIQDLTGSSKEPNFFDGTIDEKYLVTNGDVLVSWAATLDAFIWEKDEGWLNQHIFKALPNTSIVEKIYFIWLLKTAMKYMNDDNKHGIVMQHVTLPVFNNFIVPLPTISEQREIAGRLDAVCGKVDALVRNQEAQVERLKAYKQSLITETVTKGLDPTVPMKDSGVEWIGQIPLGWEVSSVRYIGFLQNGISKSGDSFGSGYPFVSYGDVYRNYELPANVTGLIETNENERKNYSVKYGDIFFTRTSETIEEVGFSCVCKQTIQNATFAGFVIRLRPYKADEKIITNYAKYYFRGSHIRTYLVKEMNLVTRASLGQTLLKGMAVIIPPKNTQHQIAAYLDKKCSQIDALIDIKQRKIEKLTAYKKSLIYEYVTGKRAICSGQ